MSATINPFRSRGILFAAKTRDDAEFNETIDAGIRASEDNKKSGYFMYLEMRRIHGDEGMDAMPRVGTTNNPKIKGDPEYTDNNPDEYVTTVNGETVRGSFVRDYADNTARGAELAAILQKIKDHATVKSEFTAMGDAVRKREQNKFTQRLSTLRSMVRTAIAFHHALSDANTLQGVDVSLALEESRDENGRVEVKDGKPVMVYADTTEPVKVKNVHNSDQVKYFSIKGFLKLDAKLAADKGGDYESFITSAARGTKGSGAEGDSKNVTINDPDSFDSGLSGFLHYLNKIEEDRAEKKKLMAFLVKPENAYVVNTIFQLEDAISKLTNDRMLCNISEAYEKAAGEKKQAA